jgi:hypothetical protein
MHGSAITASPIHSLRPARGIASSPLWIAELSFRLILHTHTLTIDRGKFRFGNRRGDQTDITETSFLFP